LRIARTSTGGPLSGATEVCLPTCLRDPPPQFEVEPAFDVGLKDLTC